MISVKCDPTMRRFEKRFLATRSVYDSSSKGFMPPHFQRDPWADCNSAASPQSWDDYGRETDLVFRKTASSISPNFRVTYQDLTESPTAAMAPSSQMSAERRAVDSMPTCSDLQLPGLSADIVSAEGIDISIIDAAFGFYSSQERDPELSMNSAKSVGTGESWWIEGGGNIPFGDFDVPFGARQPEGHPNTCCFDLTSDLANPEGVSDRSFSVWDNNSDNPLTSMAIAIENDGGSEDLGPSSIDTFSAPCNSEPRSETFHFKLEEDRGETQDFRSIIDWVPPRITDQESRNVETVCDPQSQNPNAEEDPAKHGELKRRIEDALENEGQQLGNFLSFSSERETIFDGQHSTLMKVDGRSVLREGDTKTSSVESLQTDERRRSLSENSTCSLSQSCVEATQDHGLRDDAAALFCAKEGLDSPSRAKATQKPPTTVGISLRHLKEVFHLHRPEAERKLNLKRTTFSNLSRHFGISKWPFRTLRDADKRLKHNSMLLRKPTTSREKRRKLEVQQRRLRAVKDLMYTEPHQSKDSNTLAVLLTLVEQREHRAGQGRSCGI